MHRCRLKRCGSRSFDSWYPRFSILFRSADGYPSKHMKPVYFKRRDDQGNFVSHNKSIMTRSEIFQGTRLKPIHTRHRSKSTMITVVGLATSIRNAPGHAIPAIDSCISATPTGIMSASCSYCPSSFALHRHLRLPLCWKKQGPDQYQMCCPPPKGSKPCCGHCCLVA